MAKAAAFTAHPSFFLQLTQVNEAFSEQRIAMRKQEKAAAAEAEKAAAAERAKAESAAAAEKAKLMSELQRAQMAATKADAAAKMALADVAKQVGVLTVELQGRVCVGFKFCVCTPLLER